MKIISKHKDFYDSFGFILGKPDESIVYIRKPKLLVNNKIPKDILDKLEDINYYTYGYFKYKCPYKAKICSIIAGIFPYLYINPFYYFTSQDCRGYYDNRFSIIPIDKNNTIEGIYKQINQEFVKKSKLSKNNLCIEEVNEILNESWQVECKDVFKKLNTPCFIYNGSEFNISTLKGEIFCEKYNIILDSIFNNMSINILKPNFDFIINNTNSYIDIENFLWSQKQEPEHVPDNKTKIINHGFDLKTSFRNIK